ncbi:MAG: VCBS repeat-containing protein [Deltaproteobacteria bacterium]
MGKPTAAWAALFALLHCAPLPEIDVGQCGNRVIEQGEDCDGFPLDSTAERPSDCREPGSVGQCHLDCARQSDGTLPTCPVGWGCDPLGICRRPTGAFEPLREISVGSATSLLTGDFDGDGRADIVSLEPPEGVGRTHARFHYFDERAGLAETRAFPLQMIAPVAADVSGDGRSDLLFSDPRLGLLRGRSDRNWVPDAFSSYRVDDSRLITTTVFPGQVQNSSGFVVFARLADSDGLYVVNEARQAVPQLIGELPGPVDQFVGDPVAGRALEDLGTYPCSQLLVALRDQTRFWMYDVCTTAPGVIGPAWRAQAVQSSIELDPPAAIDVAPLLVDLNGDAHLDALIGAGGISYASYGDGQGLATAVPYVLNADSAVPLSNLPMPLSARDVTGDGHPDFVLDSGVVLSGPAASGSGFDFGIHMPHAPGYWTSALAANLNGNERPDFVAASSGHPGIDFFNGTGNPYPTHFTIPTDRPVRQLVSGDFDGDGIGDVAFTQINATSGQADSVFVSFGASAGPPQTPSAVAQVNNIEQISTFREGSLDHLMVSSLEQLGDRQRSALAVLASNGDRIPVASLDLTPFAADGSTDSSAALRMTLGGFLMPQHRDVLVLALQRNGYALNLDVGLQAWLLPALASDGTPTLLRAAFDPELAPMLTGDLSSPMRLSVSSVDIDGDGRDEAAIAMPRRDGARCSVLLFAVESDRLEPRSSWIVEEACEQVEVRSLDADADGAQDLVLLTGSSDPGSGSLSVFWNDGSGGFDARRRTRLTSDAPRAFAVLRATTAHRLEIAYLNADGLSLIAGTEQAREFDPPHLQQAQEGCTGLVAADLNGDAATDLAFAARGNIHVLKATLEER